MEDFMQKELSHGHQLVDVTVVCHVVGCGHRFVVSVEQQMALRREGHDMPKRCKRCSAELKALSEKMERLSRHERTHTCPTCEKTHVWTFVSLRQWVLTPNLWKKCEDCRSVVNVGYIPMEATPVEKADEAKPAEPPKVEQALPAKKPEEGQNDVPQKILDRRVGVLHDFVHGGV